MDLVIAESINRAEQIFYKYILKTYYKRIIFIISSKVVSKRVNGFAAKLWRVSAIVDTIILHQNCTNLNSITYYNPFLRKEGRMGVITIHQLRDDQFYIRRIKNKFERRFLNLYQYPIKALMQPIIGYANITLDNDEFVTGKYYIGNSVFDIICVHTYFFILVENKFL